MPDHEHPDLGRLGEWTTAPPLTVTRAALQRFAEATLDPVPQHRAGDVAGPTVPVLFAWQCGYPQLLAALPPGLRSRTVHGAQDIHHHGPITPDCKVTTSAAIVASVPARPGLTITAHSVSRDDTGRLLVEQWTTLLIRGYHAGEPRGEVPPEQPGSADGAELGELRTPVPRGQVARYAEASGDREPIHLDAKVARASGFPDVIMHGNCTLAVAAHHVLGRAADGDVRRLRRITGRFRRPVHEGETISTRMWAPSRETVAYQARTAAGVCLHGTMVFGDRSSDDW